MMKLSKLRKSKTLAVIVAAAYPFYTMIGLAAAQLCAGVNH